MSAPKIKIKKGINKPTIIVAFPGFGLVGVITTEFLIDHLKCEQIGKYWFEELPATVAVHEGKLVHPVGVFYNKKYNLIIIHSISIARGLEWKAAEFVLEVAHQVKAKEIMCIDGVGIAGKTPSSEQLFMYSNATTMRKKLEKANVSLLKESVILGISPALLLKTSVPTTCLFAEVKGKLPDSEAAAKVIQALDKYFNMKLDTTPLLEMAKRFEEKMNHLISEAKKINEEQDAKQLSYVG